MNCLCCDKKLKLIKQDFDYNNWQRKYHKKCWNERTIYLDIIQKNPNLKNIEYYKKLSCLISFVYI